MAQEPIYNAEQIMEVIPHRYPFLMIDKIVEVQQTERIVAIKNVALNEPYFQGHFPGEPVMPGVLILEAMAQTGVFFAKTDKNGIPKDKNLYFVGANDVKWKRKVVPGDTLRIEMNFDKKKGPIWMMSGNVTVDGVLVAEGKIVACEG